jgi:hemolysin activation/secretion protein
MSPMGFGRMCAVAFFLAAFALADAGLSAARAQQSPDLSNIDRRIKEREQRLLPKEGAPLPDLGRAKVPAEAVTAFTLSGVVIEGATAIEPARFAPLYEEFLATTVGSTEVSEILRRITQLYQDEGYFLTTAEAPPQAITAGVMRVRVIEGRISRFSVTGDESKRDLVGRYAHTVLGERPSRLDTVERALLLMEDLPGITVTPNLVPIGGGTGEYELVARIDAKLVDASVQADNRGTPEVGRLQGFLNGALNDALGFGESISANFATVPTQPEELLYGAASVAVPVGNAGTYVSALGAYGAVDPGSTKAAVDSEIRIAQFLGRIWHPLLRSRQQSLWLSGTFDYRNFREQQFDDTVISDRLRTFRAAATYGLTDGFNGDNQVKLEVSQGIDFLGASDPGSPTLSRPDGRSDFTKLTGAVIRVQKITDRIGLQLGVAGQWSADPLLSYEEFSLGGEQFGRAYDYGEVTGDDGIAGSGELRYGDATKWPWLNEYQVYGFYDIGAVWNDQPDGGSTRDSLTSAGGGLRLMLTNHLRATFEAAKPLTRTVQTTDDKDWRFFFSAGVTY